MHRPALAERFRLDISNPPAQSCVLNKLATYLAARAAGVPTPRFWVAESPQELRQLEASWCSPSC